jgi:dolichyl-phosphate-mannose-protein mannosyltransferase
VTILPVVAAMALALVLRLPYMHVPLGPDEGGLSFIASQWGSGHGSLYGAYWLDRPPLLLGLFKLADGATGVRILGCVAALALVVTTSLAAGALAGRKAAGIAALLAAVFTGAPALAATGTPAELLAAAPAAASVGCLIAAHRRRQTGWLVGAGACALLAPLIKQSFLDAGAAGLAFLVITHRPRAVAAYVAGALVPLAALAAFLGLTGTSPGELFYALFGFRLAGLQSLGGSLGQRMAQLEGPVLHSGLVLALAMALVGLWRQRSDRVLTVTLATWVAAGVVGVLLGGYYWPHYLIQLVAPAAVLTSAALASAPVRARLAAAGVAAAVAVTSTVVGVSTIRDHPPHRTVLEVANYLRRHARPGDTDYVLYAKANLDYYAGLPSPYPYEWSLMLRAIPGARTKLDTLLASSKRPTWVVGWQPPSQWGFDASGRTRTLLHHHYRTVATVAGHPLYLRRDVPQEARA